MNPRVLDFLTGIEASPQPDAGTPVNPNDVLTLSFFEDTAAAKRRVLGSRSSPELVPLAGLTITAGEEYQHDILAYVAGDGGAIDVTGNPQITHVMVDGDTLELRGCSDTNTLKLDDGNGLDLNSDSIILKNGSIIKFLYNGAVLEETYRNGIEG